MSLTPNLPVRIAGRATLVVLPLALAWAAPNVHAANQPLDNAPVEVPIPLNSGRPGEPKHELYSSLYHHRTEADVVAVLARVLTLLEANTPYGLIDRETQQPITDFNTPNPRAALVPARFRVVSYEWGVAYSGMLKAAEITGEPRYRRYVDERFRFIAAHAPYVRKLYEADPRGRPPMRSVVAPRSLDDAGAMCASMIRGLRAGVDANLRPIVDGYIEHIHTKQFRLPDGTLARHGPIPETIWADDLYMSVPALAEMGKLTGDRRYYDDAAKQVLQFGEKLFRPDRKIFAHGYLTANVEHRIDFHWARANGWCALAMADLLDVLPEDHPQRGDVLKLYRTHMEGITELQSGYGLWHQMLDRTDSYLETSASAMFVAAIARGVNRGWLSPVYGSVAQIGWNAVATRVNAQGEVEGTCVGTNFALDMVYYYSRPVSVEAEHGYGPVLLAGSEIIALIRNPAVEKKKQNAIYFAPAAK